MDRCPNCGAEMIPLFTGSACKAECDLRPAAVAERPDVAYYCANVGEAYRLGQLMSTLPGPLADRKCEAIQCGYNRLLVIEGLEDVAYSRTVRGEWNGEYYEYTEGEWVYGKVEDNGQ